MPASEAVLPVPPFEAAGHKVPPVPCDCRPVEELLALYKGLVEVSTLINAITDFNELLTEIMDVARRVMRAEGSTLFLLDEPTGELRLVIARSATGEMSSAHLTVPRNGSVAGWVFEHAESALIEIASAGHCVPWLVRGGVVDEIEVASGTPMAILPSARYASSLLSLAPGEWLTVYADGLTDSRKAAGGSAQLGSAGARRLLEKPFANPQYVVATLSHGEASHRGDSPPQDDLTLLAFGFHA